MIEAIDSLPEIKAINDKNLKLAWKRYQGEGTHFILLGTDMYGQEPDPVDAKKFYDHLFREDIRQCPNFDLSGPQGFLWHGKWVDPVKGVAR